MPQRAWCIRLESEAGVSRHHVVCWLFPIHPPHCQPTRSPPSADLFHTLPHSLGLPGPQEKREVGVFISLLPCCTPGSDCIPVTAPARHPLPWLQLPLALVTWLPLCAPSWEGGGGCSHCQAPGATPFQLSSLDPTFNSLQKTPSECPLSFLLEACQVCVGGLHLHLVGKIAPMVV